MADTRLAALDARISELSAQASTLGATDREIRSLGGTVAETKVKPNPILEQARIQTAPTALPSVEDVATDSAAGGSSTGPTPVQTSLQAVQSELNVNSSRIEDSIHSLEKGAAESKVATGTITSSLEEIAASSQIAAAAISNADLGAQSAVLTAFEAAGGLEAQTQLIAELAVDSDRVSNLLDKKVDISNDEFTGIGLIDNIINDFRSIQLDSEISAAQRKRAATSKEIANIQNSTESVSATSLKTKKTITEASIEANHKQIAAKSKILGAEAELKNVATNANAVTAILNADSRKLANLQSVLATEENAEDRAMRREVFNHQKNAAVAQIQKWKDGQESRDIQLEQSKLALKTAQETNPSAIPAAIARNEKVLADIADLEKLETDMVTGVQNAQSLAGLPVESDEIILRGISRPGAVGKKYERLLEIGGSADRVLGLTPAEAQINLSVIAPSGINKPTKSTKILDEVARRQADEFATAETVVPKTAEGLEADFNTRANVFMKVKAADIRTGDLSNPYHGAAFSTLEQSTSIQSTPLYQKVLKDKQMKELNPELILDSAIAGVTAKVITPEEAASGIDAIFTQASVLNNMEDGGFRRVGLTNQTTYNVVLKRSPTAFEGLKSGLEGLAKSPVLLAGIGGAVISGDADSFKKQMANITDRFSTVDLMNTTMLQNHIVKLLSAQTPVPAGDTQTSKNNQ